MESKNRNGFKKFGRKILALSMFAGVSFCAFGSNEANAINPPRPTNPGKPLGGTSPSNSLGSPSGRVNSSGTGNFGLDFSTINVPGGGNIGPYGRLNNPELLGWKLGERLQNFIIKQ
ncbi:hypothetical protein [Candidatus Arthromitus sp. SFB-rat-Yit]|uniref:hypothetical protein n=1 Tax=Candidatus Arthromitus sp. SFB-rat-Yit TaxID=1041504 RepID=UPI000227A735|nr:hypothetical protein [Candidatus Arthromitus sp. SFB-rat-Yit]BAK80649.1 hypothetical protein RATSFB_0087 [Candidatus Arthromitus sp. SFB-rat-Yit]